MSLEQEKLMNIYNETLTLLNHQTKKYNLKTIKNLIFHFDNIKDDGKQLVFSEICNYLSFIKEVKLTESGRASKKESNELFMSFISPLIKYYLPLGFTANFSFGIIIFVAIFSTPILLILNLPFYCYAILFVILLVLKLRSYFKEKEHKVYGTLY